MTSNLLDKFKELNSLYCELTWKMRDVEIPVKDRDTTALSNRGYYHLLESGTVVKFKDHRYFYSCPLGMMDLEGAWTDEESNTYSVYEFLCMVVDSEQPVEVVLEG
nr:MAG TPA: hypothetical protein [Caudoviricetes sp.]